MPSKSTTLRAALERAHARVVKDADVRLSSGEISRPVLAAGAHDGLGARLAERAGFDAIWASSFEISAAAGLPDLSLLCMSEYLQAAVSMNEAVDIPIIADCDTGFGDARNVARMVRCYEAAGIAGVCIEDKVFPKVNSFIDRGQELLPAEEHALKISVAKKVQRDPDFLCLARTEALIAGQDLDEALRRGRCYAAAGADALLVHCKDPTPDRLFAFLARWEQDIPIALVPTTYNAVHRSELLQHGASMVIYANYGLRAALRAIATTFEHIMASGSSRDVEDDIASVKEVFELQHTESWLSLNLPSK